MEAGLLFFLLMVSGDVILALLARFMTGSKPMA
jgi:hypothetical protein